MKADLRFTNQPLSFWAHVRIISQQVGYTERIKRRDRVAERAKAKGTGRATGPVRVPTLSEMKEALEGIGLSSGHIVDGEDRPVASGEVRGGERLPIESRCCHGRDSDRWISADGSTRYRGVSRTPVRHALATTKIDPPTMIPST